MAQVALQTGPTSTTWGSSATPTLDTPAGADGERQLLIVTWSNGGSVVAPSITGWTHVDEKYITSTQNRTAIYSRVISGTVSAGTVGPTFSAAVSGRSWAGSFNGIPVAVALVTDSSWSSWRVVPATSASEAESLHLVMMTSAAYPRTVATVTGYTEVHDAYRYHSGGGVWVGINRKDVAAGSVASSTWVLWNEAASAEAGDQTIYASIILGPIPAASATADITIDGEFPIPTTVEIARTTGGTLAVNATDTVTATVRDHNGDPIRNVVPVVGTISGGVFTLGVFSATGATGQATATLTGAAIGAAALIVSVGAAYSNELTVNVVGDTVSTITTVAVTPVSATIGVDSTQQFAVTVTGTGGFDAAVIWSIVTGAGAISSSGLFSAGSAAGLVNGRATSVQDPAKYADFSIDVTLGSITCIWTQGEVALANTTLSYKVSNSEKTVIATGTTTTSVTGSMTVAIPGGYAGQSVVAEVNNLGANMIPAGKIHAQQVVVV